MSVVLKKDMQPNMGRVVDFLMETLQNDYCVSRDWDPNFVACLFYEGFLPVAAIALGSCFLLPKLHVERCVVKIDSELPHISRKLQKSIRTKTWSLTVNKCFDEVIKQCQANHADCWLYPQLAECLTYLNRCSSTCDAVRALTIEVWSGENATGKLIAGELGITIGACYVSMTGFFDSNYDGAGQAQLRALSLLLHNSGCKQWDLGMFIEYKRDLGCVTQDRKTFISERRAFRALSLRPLMPSGTTSLLLRDLLKRPTIPKPVADPKSKTQRKKAEKRKRIAEAKRTKAARTAPQAVT
ncbi:Leu phe-trna protein transferase [Diplonema papillatum]|nr:Leu phe-trna protein transferase [Diplonema papillatum]